MSVVVLHQALRLRPDGHRDGRIPAMAVLTLARPDGLFDPVEGLTYLFLADGGAALVPNEDYVRVA